jgi:hypothetical protein
MSVTINAPTTPTFTQVGLYCQNVTPAILPTLSDNGIAGSWSPGEISTISVGIATYAFTPTITASPNCATDATMDITVSSLPNVSLGAFNSVCDTAGMVDLYGGSPSGGTYNGTSVINNSFNTLVGVGSYLITYNYTNSEGCGSSASESLSVISCAISIAEIFKNDITLYPIPTIDQLTLETNETLIGKTFFIHDLCGKVIFSGKLVDNKTLIEISTLSSGTYYLRLPEINQTLRFVKQ